MANLVPQTAAPPPGQIPRGVRQVFLILVVVAVVVAGWGLFSRYRAESVLAAETSQAAIPVVTLIRVGANADSQQIQLPGTVQAYFEAPIYARTSGYVKAWYTDIGTRVHAGQVLAELDTPEIDDQLRQAQADLANAEASYSLARVTAGRWIALRKTESVSAQDADEKVSDAEQKKAAVASAAANVARLRHLQDFKRVVAPFGGVVTARLTDVGALITDGTSTQLFRVADTSRLRVYVQVPQLYAADLKVGDSVDLTFAEHPGSVFKARLARTANALDPSSRTLLVELALDNADGTLLPGGYTQALFKLPARAAAVRIPVSALLFRADGLHVATLRHRPEGDIAPDSTAQVTLRTVTLGRDFGTALEITTGLAPGETILSDPPDSVIEGETVRVADAGKGGAP